MADAALDILFAGTAGSAPTAQRGLPAALVTWGGEQLLIDCGEGTQRQLMRAGGLPELDAIFITHLHADHWLGLPGLIKSLELRERERPLTVYGPQGLRRSLLGLGLGLERTAFEMTLEEMSDGQQARFSGYSVEAVAVAHRMPAFGYALIEDERPGRVDAAEAARLGLSGPEIGMVSRGQAVRGIGAEQLMGPARAGRRVVFSGDTARCERLTQAAHGAEVLVHEASFTVSERARARKTAHSTAYDAGQVANAAGVGLLALYHLGGRYLNRQLRDEARSVFSNTVAARDFGRITVPLPEKGKPSYTNPTQA